MGSSTTRSFVEFQGVSRTFKGGDAPFSLSGIDLSIPRGSVVIVAGPSGSGKSTLLNLLACLDRPDGGRILCDGECISHAPESRRSQWRSSVGFVFQHHLLPSGVRAVDAVAAPLLWARGLAPGTAIERAGEVLRSVGLESEAGKKVERLSGGQRQRVAIARALAVEPSLVLADEPTAQLDRESANAVSTLLRDHARRTGATMLVVSHEDQPGDWGATMNVAMENGRIARCS